MLIGLHGPAGAGKDSVAAVIKADHIRRGERCRATAFAERLYLAVSAITGLSPAVLRHREAKEKVIPWLGKSPRQLLQSLGTEWGRTLVHPDIWVRATLEDARPWLARGISVVITDVRFDNEAEAIRQAGGRVLRITRPNASCLAGDTAQHPSEAGISPHLIDGEIVNDGGLDALEKKVLEAILK
jgi:hypothetical protein